MDSDCSRSAYENDIDKDNFIQELTSELIKTYDRCQHMADTKEAALPDRLKIIDIINGVINLLYPGFYSQEGIEGGKIKPYYISVMLASIARSLSRQIACSLCHNGENVSLTSDRDPVKITKSFLKCLPKLETLLEEDVRAAYDGDPAAKSYHEIVFCYPGIEAITIYRMAHELLLLGVPLIPRMMTEYAHMKTGIDIHPGATIGKAFFIDHGTGVVIGETCHLGNNVKIYQGVTLGALSFPKDSQGNIIRAKKRHPTLEDNVVVYANATILGGDTIIGKDSVVGSNVWLMQTVAPSTLVTLEKPSLRIKTQSGDFIPSSSK